MRVGWMDIEGEICDVFLVDGVECIEGGFIEGKNGVLIPVWMEAEWTESNSSYKEGLCT